MKLITVRWPLGRKEHISAEAAEIALAVDVINSHPGLAAQLKPALEMFRSSALLVSNVRKNGGAAALDRVVKSAFPHE